MDIPIPLDFLPICYPDLRFSVVQDTDFQTARGSGSEVGAHHYFGHWLVQMDDRGQDRLEYYAHI
jgi:hypothetical protein